MRAISWCLSTLSVGGSKVKTALGGALALLRSGGTEFAHDAFFGIGCDKFEKLSILGSLGEVVGEGGLGEAAGVAFPREDQLEGIFQGADHLAVKTAALEADHV